MDKRWWEGIATFLTDYWWVLLILLALVLLLIFTRDIWMPLLSAI